MFMQVLLCIALAIAVLLIGREVGKLLFKGGQDLSAAKRSAQTLAIALREMGLKRVPAMLEEFVVGDVPDLLENIRDLAKLAKDGNQAVILELESTFDRCLAMKLSKPEGRALIAARLAEAEKQAADAAKFAPKA